ncbi:alpha-hydroxy acid oxidase [Actinoplanes sp. NPDC023801]|uniref:alpha-hydroxy acid oxidase n=1 Tax=Actinoplanes sp. NPDC023801 TaxID=3154595 RepID=UPI00340A314B
MEPTTDPRFVCAADYEPQARAAVPPDVWDYISGGSGAERALAANRAAFDRFALRPRVLVDVSARDTAVTLLGSRLRGPVGIAPTAYHAMMHPDGEVATAQGAARAGALYVTSFFSGRSLRDIAAAAGPAPRWLQIYWMRDREALGGVLDLAAEAGYTAVVLTVDSPVIGHRLRDLRNGFAFAPELRPVNVERAAQSLLHRRVAGRSAVADHAVRVFDPALNWSDLAWLRERTDLPIVLKGVQTGEDGELAAAHGVDAVIVSNHGGRQLDTPLATLDVLPEVVAAVGGRCPVLVDGGIRSGVEALTAIALGATAVLIGRPVLWALAVRGADGVAHLLDMLNDEVSDAMALTGLTDLRDAGPAHVRVTARR